MKKQINTTQSGSPQLDHTIKRVMGGTFPLPEQVEQAKNEAFAKIRAMADGEEPQGNRHAASSYHSHSQPITAKNESKEIQNMEPAHDSFCQPITAENDSKKEQAYVSQKSPKKFKKTFFRGLAVAGAAIISCIYFANTGVSASAQIPIVSRVFENLGENLEFAGDYANLAEPVKYAETGMETKTVNGTSVTLSEAYCNETALYLSLVVHSEEPLPDTFVGQDGKPIIEIRSLVDFNFDEEGMIDWTNGGNWHIDGKMADEYTYAGVIRFGLKQYYANQNIEIPENFHVKLSFSQIIGTKLEDARPKIPQELKDQYEAGMKENGLGLTDEERMQFTEEQKAIEEQLYEDMMDGYFERYPERLQYPNHYDNWILDGPWDFEFDVSKSSKDIVRKEINDVDENGLGLIAVTKTPVEITLEREENLDHFPVVFDADGNLLETSSSSFDTVSISGHDTSKIDVYICSYIEYMDELKTYYWTEGYEERAKTKTFQQLLDERALYHKEIVFDGP